MRRRMPLDVTRVVVAFQAGGWRSVVDLFTNDRLLEGHRCVRDYHSAPRSNLFMRSSLSRSFRFYSSRGTIAAQTRARFVMDSPMRGGSPV
jgi:hypothetical protein